jgi:hypothetical protein
MVDGGSLQVDTEGKSKVRKGNFWRERTLSLLLRNLPATLRSWMRFIFESLITLELEAARKLLDAM